MLLPVVKFIERPDAEHDVPFPNGRWSVFNNDFSR